jgi:hypothetical protein
VKAATPCDLGLQPGHAGAQHPHAGVRVVPALGAQSVEVSAQGVALAHQPLVLPEEQLTGGAGARPWY